jgi:cytochrome c553
VTILNLVKSVVSAALLTALSSTLVLAQGSVEAGKAKAATCAACHGPTGNDSVLPNVPKLGGQGERYLVKQLHEIKADIRKVPLMTPFVAAMSEQDMADLAAYFASLEAPRGAVEKAKLELGQKLYRAGDAKLGVAACSACHAPDGKGIASAGFPALSGQDTPYVDLQLKSFRSGDRNNDQSDVMRMVTARLNDKEIAALASYVAGLH